MHSETVLIIDDGKDNRQFLIDYVLKPNGFQALEAADGLEGLNMAIEHKPDLILLDFQMPRLNGRQVLEKMRERHLDIPVILMTLHGSEEIAIEVYRLGVRDYVKKPYYPEEMLAAIDRALAETRLRRERDALTERVLSANRELQRRVKELNTLYHLGKSVTSLADMAELLPRIVDAMVQVTGAEEAFLALIENKQLVKRAMRDQLMAKSKTLGEVIDDVIAWQAIKTRQPIVTHPEVIGKGHGSSVYVPVVWQDRPMGVLAVANFQPSSPLLTQQDAAMLSAMSDYVAIAIQNSRNFAALLKSKDKLRATFEQFVAPTVVEQVLARKDEIKLGGQRQEISVLFADIRGYTAWSESVEPEVLVETLNHYLNLAAGVILSWEGTLDKYLGDGLMAIFNAPLPQADHVFRAADAALAVQRAVQEVNAQHGHQLAVGIGVTVGEAVVGYIGNERALNYTAVGDTVNVAKRLQEMAQPGQILIDERLVARLGSKVRGKSLGEVMLKGRHNGTKIFELHDLIG
ncbi:MAG: adenylate/guanylate cyclase domain-containing protein [Anaerolineae bacterium]